MASHHCSECGMLGQWRLEISWGSLRIRPRARRVNPHSRFGLRDVPLPSHGFLHRSLSDACPLGAIESPQAVLTGWHPTTLNNCRLSLQRHTEYQSDRTRDLRHADTDPYRCKNMRLVQYRTNALTVQQRLSLIRTAWSTQLLRSCPVRPSPAHRQRAASVASATRRCRGWDLSRKMY